MNQVSRLAEIYKRHVSAPWPRTLAGAQRVMMIVYPKEKERVLRSRVPEFSQATEAAGHPWQLVDVTAWFAEWLVNDLDDVYREDCFRDPEHLAMPLASEFSKMATDRLSTALRGADSNTVVGLLGTGSLYGFLRVSELIRSAATEIRGRLAVFFPGTMSNNVYRLLDARDGSSYLAQPITLDEVWMP